MASTRSAKYPYQWPDGSWHSQTRADYEANQQHATNAGASIAQYGAQYGMGGAQGASGTVGINGKPVTPEQWASGDFLKALVPDPAARVAAGIDQPTAQPVDPALESARLIGGRNVAVGRGNAAYDAGNLGFDYGYNADGTINTANPYSRAAMLQLDYEHQKAGTQNGMAAAGQLNSGAYGRAQGRNDRNYAMGDAANRLGYQRGMHGIQTGLLGTFANAGTGVSDADFQALLRATYPGS